MKLSSLCSKKLVFLDHHFDSYDKILDFASEQLSKAASVPVSDIKNAFIEREHIGTTFLGHRLALPHAYIESLKTITILFIRLDQPLIVDIGTRSFVMKYIFAVLTSKENSQTYLKILSSIARLVVHKTYILDQATSPDHFIKLIEQNDIAIDEHLTAKDLITSHHTIDVDATIAHAVDIMNRQNVTFLPVIDSSHHLKGIIDLPDLLKAAFPNDVIDSTSMGFIKDMGSTSMFFEPLTHFYNNKDKKYVRDVMRKVEGLVINEDARYVDIVFLATKKHLRNLVVTNKNNEVLGIVDTYDILHLVIKG